MVDTTQSKVAVIVSHEQLDNVLRTPPDADSVRTRVRAANRCRAPAVGRGVRLLSQDRCAGD